MTRHASRVAMQRLEARIWFGGNVLRTGCMGSGPPMWLASDTGAVPPRSYRPRTGSLYLKIVCHRAARQRQRAGPRAHGHAPTDDRNNRGAHADMAELVIPKVHRPQRTHDGATYSAVGHTRVTWRLLDPVARSGYAIRRRKEVRKLGFHSSTCLKFMNQDNGPAFIVLLWAFLFNFACVLLFTTWVSTFKARPERWKHVWPIQLAVTL